MLQWYKRGAAYMHDSKAADQQEAPKNRPTFGHIVLTAWAMSARHLVCRCPTLGP